MGRLGRDPVALNREVMQAGWQGMDRESALTYMSQGTALDIVNLLPGQRGKLRRRGAIRNSFRYTLSATSIDSVWSWQDPSPSSNAIKALVHGIDGPLFRSDLYTYAPANPVVLDSQAAVARPGLVREIRQRHVQLGGFVYGLCSGITPNVLRWNGGTGFVALANTPAALGQATSIASHLNRLWLASGTALYFSDDGGPTTDAAKEWQDDVTGLTNQIQLPEPIMGLALRGDSLVIFTRTGLWELRGSSPSTFVLRRQLDTRLTDQDSIVEWDDTLIYVSDNGVVMYDGGGLRPMSPGVSEGFYDASAKAVRVDREFLFVSTPYQSWLCHVPSGAWARFTYADKFETQFTVTRIAGDPFFIDGKGLYGIGRVGKHEQGATYVPFGDLYVTQTNSTPQTRGISVSTSSRYYRLAMPGEKARLQRVMLDYCLVPMDSFFGVTAQLQLRSEKGDVIFTGTVPSTETDGGEASDLVGFDPHPRGRYVAECFAEVESIHVALTVTASPTTAPAEVEIHDMTLEFAPAQQRTAPS